MLLDMLGLGTVSIKMFATGMMFGFYFNFQWNLNLDRPDYAPPVAPLHRPPPAQQTGGKLSIIGA